LNDSENQANKAIEHAAQRAKQFILNKDVDNYLKSKLGPSGKYNIKWWDLVWLRSNPRLFGRYLLTFPVEKRRIPLLREEVIGFSQTQLYDLYGIHKELSGVLKGVRVRKESKEKRPPIIRNILGGSFGLDRRFLAFISILARVPIRWLEEEKPPMIWEVYHFNYLDDIRVDLEEFLQLLKEVESKPLDYHDVRPLILMLEGKEELHLRMEVLGCSFFIELFDVDNPLKKVKAIKQIVGPFAEKQGVVTTVIPSQINYALVGKGYKKVPPEFKPMDF